MSVGLYYNAIKFFFFITQFNMTNVFIRQYNDEEHFVYQYIASVHSEMQYQNQCFLKQSLILCQRTTNAV